jgi:excisionase family DNA binding protein
MYSGGMRTEDNGIPWLSTGDIAAILGVDSKTVRRWIDAGRIKNSGYGVHRRVRHADFWRFVDSRKEAQEKLSIGNDQEPTVE